MKQATGAAKSEMHSGSRVRDRESDQWVGSHILEALPLVGGDTRLEEDGVEAELGEEQRIIAVDFGEEV